MTNFFGTPAVREWNPGNNLILVALANSRVVTFFHVNSTKGFVVISCDPSCCSCCRGDDNDRTHHAFARGTAILVTCPGVCSDCWLFPPVSKGTLGGSVLTSMSTSKRNHTYEKKTDQQPQFWTQHHSCQCMTV